MNHRSINQRSFAALGFLRSASRLKPLICFSVALAFALPISAQDKYELSDSPPPLKQVSAEERKRLDSQKGAKDRTKTALEMMELRLTKASTKVVAEDFTGAFLELGGFHGLMEDMLRYLDSLPGKKSATLSNYKRFEIGLRRLAPQLELLRREMPPEKERYIYYLARDLRDVRSKAIEPLFGDTVVPGLQQDKP